MFLLKYNLELLRIEEACSYNAVSCHITCSMCNTDIILQAVDKVERHKNILCKDADFNSILFSEDKILTKYLIQCCVLTGLRLTSIF